MKGVSMKTIKKAFMFCLILVCCSYFVIKAKTSLDLRVQGASASSSSETDLEKNAISIVNTLLLKKNTIKKLMAMKITFLKVLSKKSVKV